MEVGLATPNIIMKGINIFLMANVIKDFLYNYYDRIINSSAVKERQQEKKKKSLLLKVFEMMPHGTLEFQIAF